MTENENDQRPEDVIGERTSKLVRHRVANSGEAVEIYR